MTSLPVGPYRWLLACAVLIVFTASALILTTDDASAWTTADLQPAEKEYRSAFVYTLTSEYYRGEYVFPSYTSIPVQSGYGGYMSYPVSHLDDRTHIESASISIIARNSGSVTLNVKVMDREFHELDPEIALNSIWKATSAGTVTISTGLAYRTYTVSITGAALEDIRDVIAGDDEYLVIAFDLSSLGWVDIFARYIDISGTYYSTLNLEYDDEAPEEKRLHPGPVEQGGDGQRPAGHRHQGADGDEPANRRLLPAQARDLQVETAFEEDDRHGEVHDREQPVAERQRLHPAEPVRSERDSRDQQDHDSGHANVPRYRLRQDADRQCQHQRQRRVIPLHLREPTPPPTSTTRSARSGWSARWAGSRGPRPPRRRAVCTARCAAAGDARSEATDASADLPSLPRRPSPATAAAPCGAVIRPGATSVRA